MNLTLRGLALIVGATGLLAGCAASKAGAGNPAGGDSSTPLSSMSSSASAADTSTPAEPSTSEPPADFSAFAGQWTGHDRYLTISSTGLGSEHVGDGCCDPQVDVTFQLSGPLASGSDAKALLTVTAVTVHTGYAMSKPAPKVGDIAGVGIADGIFTEVLTGITYCDPAQEAKGSCGA